VQAHEEGLPWQDMAVLLRARSQMPAVEQALRRAQVPMQSMNEQAFRRFDWQQPSAKLLTLHSAKGLEFPWVCVAALQSLPMGNETLDDALRLLYVGMTRATQQLLLSASGDSLVVQRVQAAQRQVAQRSSRD